MKKKHGSLITQNSLIRGGGGIFGIIIGVFLISGFFPRQFPRIDMIRIKGQQVFFSSLSDVRYSYAEYEHNQETTGALREMLLGSALPGDLLFSYRAGFVTNDLIEGKRKHASIYLGTKHDLLMLIEKSDLLKNKSIDLTMLPQRDDSEPLILDSTEKGVSVRSVDALTFLDDLLVIRLKRPLEDRQRMLITVLGELGKAYNYDFDIQDTSSIYCAQLIYLGLAEIGIHIPYTSFAGRSYLYPQDIIDYIDTLRAPDDVFFRVKERENIQSDLAIEK